MMTPALTYGSVCSGIEAASIAWHSLGWRAAFLSEIDAFPRAVLKHHYPETPLHGDFTTIRAGEYEPIDLLVGGTPCQSFSVAGLRGGLDDDRGNLALEYLKLVDRLRPRWVVWENVPGVLSSNRGRDFGSILGGLVELGYGFAYRVLDAQFFGVPQRRRRVFVVGYLGDWRPAAAVLFERQSLQGHSPPSRTPRESIARPIGAGSPGGSGYRNDADTADNLIANCLNAKGGSGCIDAESETFIAHSLRADGFDASEDGTGRGTPLVPVEFDPTQITSATNRSNPQPGGPCHPLAPGAHAPAIAFNLRGREGGSQPETADVASLRAATGGSSRSYVAQTLTAAQHRSGGALAGNSAGVVNPVFPPAGGVRRLTPRECERLQGFPDDYTLIPYRGKFAADGPRYKALGNSMAIPVMRWIGERIQSVESITQRMAA